MRILRIIAICLGLVIFQTHSAIAETVLKCPRIYGNESDLIKIDRNWFGKRTVENLINGQWRKIEVVKATEECVLTSDGWEYNNLKLCFTR